MARARGTRIDPPDGGPSIAAVALWGAAPGRRLRLFTEAERAALNAIASVVRFRRGEVIYQEGDRAAAVFNIAAGMVKTCKTLPDGTRHVTAFLFPDDVFGLAERGKYVNEAEAVTAVTGYRMPAGALESALRRDAGLDFDVITKLCHELRETQRHALLLGKRHAVAKIALFLEMLESHQAASGESAIEIYLPMNRSDIADYVGMTLAAVTRSFQLLESEGVIEFRDRRHVAIRNRRQLERIASEHASVGLARGRKVPD